MNRWLHHAQDDIPNPYASASEEGVFRSLRPVLNVPLQEYPHFPCSPQSARLTPRRGQMSSPQLYGGTPLFSQDMAYLDRAHRAGKIVVPPVGSFNFYIYIYSYIASQTFYNVTKLSVRKVMVVSLMCCYLFIIKWAPQPCGKATLLKYTVGIISKCIYFVMQNT